MLDALALIENPRNRQDALISIASRFKEVGTEIAQAPFDERHRVPACESEVFAWRTTSEEGGRELHFAVQNCSAVSARALCVMLAEGLRGATPEQVQAVPEEIVCELFGEQTNSQKGLGLSSIVRFTKLLCQ